MYDPKGKRRDLRRAYYTSSGFNVRNEFDKENPKLAKSWTHRDAYYELADQWIRERLGNSPLEHAYWGGSVPAWYRQGFNQRRRCREKQSIRDLVANMDAEDFENFLFPRFRRDVRWNWY